MPRLSPSPAARERFTRIYEYLMEGRSYSEIGKIFGISKQRVQQVIKNFASAKQYDEIRKRIETRSMNTFLAKEILAELEAGHSCYAISKNVGCSVSLVKKISAKRNKEKEVSCVRLQLGG
jgi:DNA-binding CsgD family transcriptional regulator